MKPQQILDWKAAAIADGWSCEPTYGTSESVDRAARLKREGFQVQIISREPLGYQTKPYYDISAWGPDGLTVRIPVTYDWQIMRDNLLRCSECGTLTPHVQRVGFAGRCCDACLPKARAKYEYPGWTN